MDKSDDMTYKCMELYEERAHLENTKELLRNEMEHINSEVQDLERELQHLKESSYADDILLQEKIKNRNNIILSYLDDSEYFIGMMLSDINTRENEIDERLQEMYIRNCNTGDDKQ